MTIAYAELHAISNFTFLRGASRPEELVERAHALGYSALAITDECSVAGAVRAHVAAKEHRLPLVIGAELALECGLKLVALATNRRGYGRLTRVITRGRRAAEKGTYRLQRTDIENALDECLLLWLPSQPAPAEEDGRWLVERFAGRFWVGVELLRGGRDREHLVALERIGARLGVPLVACGDVHMHVRARRALQDAVTAVRLNVPVAQAGWRLYPNGERYLRERARLARLYPRRLTDETLAVAERCTFSLDEVRYQYPRSQRQPRPSLALWGAED